MKISVLIPCHNEEKSIRRCVESCFLQTRKPDEILVIDDGSTDTSAQILAEFGDAIRVITIAQATGNKSHAQEYGLKFVTGDVFIATDGDTLLDLRFVERIAHDFEDSKVVAVGGYVRSMKYNWLTRCRAYDYTIGQNLHKLAQSHIQFMFVIPGAAGAFRTDIFRQYLSFDHDTLTEDLDFTYKLHKNSFRIHYNREAIVYTQDPADLHSYINQMRRWFAGGWQNLMKHYDIIHRPAQALELSLMYIEGLVFSALLLLMPFINLYFTFIFVILAILAVALISVYAAIKERRLDIILVAPLQVMLSYVNAYIFIEQFIKEVLLKRKSLVWFKPERIQI